jgi:hypothetical protein
MTALETMKKELTAIQKAMNDLQTETGRVPAHHRYRYSLLIREATRLREAIETFRRVTA